MKKKKLKPAVLLSPIPVSLVSCADKDGRTSIANVGWMGVACMDPPMVTISLRPGRYSHDIIKESGEFVINLPTSAMAEATDMCGILSGRDADKFETAGFTRAEGDIVSAPLIAECPLNMECQLKEIVPLGAHDMFLGEVVATHVDEKAVGEGGSLDASILDSLGFCTHDNTYRRLGPALGSYGFSRKA